MIDFQKRVAYIRLDKFDLGNFNVDYGAKIVASVGTRSSLLRNAKDFDFLDKNPQKVWELRYHNPNTTSFIFTLAKKRIFGGDIPIGEVELKLSNFETNKIAKQIYPEVRGENDIESIIGIAKINGQNIFLVKIVNFPKLMRIPSSILRHICPIKIIKFYESKIRQDSAKHNF